MPTQEERITTLEQGFASFTREITRYNRKTDENLTILLGIAQAQSLDFKRVFTRLDTMDERLDKVEVRLDTVDERLGNLEYDMKDVKTVQNEHTSLLRQILERLPK